MPTNRQQKRWAGLTLAAGLAVVLVIVLANRGQAPQVQMVKVGREDLTASITSNGKVEPVAPVVARAQFATFVENVNAAEGQPVRRGQVVLTLAVADVRAQLSQARSALLAAQNDLRNARAGGNPDEVAQLNADLANARAAVASLERKQQALTALAAKQAATQEEVLQNQASLEQARTNLATVQQKKDEMARRAQLDTERAELHVKQVQDQVASLEAQVRSATVVAATDATLYSLPVHRGDYVQMGQILAEMADLRNVRVRAFVDEPDLGSLEERQEVQVTWDAMAGRSWVGQIVQVPKQVVPRGSRSVGEVLCSVDNAKLELLPNVNVEVRILVRERRGALVVPRAAVRYDNGKRYVFVVEGDKARKHEISVGAGSATKYEILAGLREGDQVVLPGDLELRDGMEVRAAETR